MLVGMTTLGGTRFGAADGGVPPMPDISGIPIGNGEPIIGKPAPPAPPSFAAALIFSISSGVGPIFSD